MNSYDCNMHDVGLCWYYTWTLELAKSIITGTRLFNSPNINSVQEKVESIDLMNYWKTKHHILDVSHCYHHVTAIDV